MADQILSSEIYLSRDRIRLQLIDYMQSYMELQNIDLTKQSFVSYIVNVLSTLTSNLLFYGSSTYNEFFMTKAKLPESIYNLSAFLGYKPTEAESSVANVMMVVPLTFTASNINITIPDEFTFMANDTPFKTFYSTLLNIKNNSAITITSTMIDTSGNIKSFPLPYQVDATNNILMFVLPTRQRSYEEQEFVVSSDIQPYQFYDIVANFTGKLESLEVFVTAPGSRNTVEYYQKNSLFMMDNITHGYTMSRLVNGVRVTFGNGLMGVQPAANSTVVLKIKTTLGADGNVYPGSIASGQKLYYVASNMRQEVLYYCTNPESSVGGADGESLQEIRINSIDSLRMMDRLVSGTDYKRMDLIMKNNLFNQNSLPVLKRSDLRCNEIQTFTTLSYSDGTSAYGIVPTKNLYVNLPTNVDIINRGTIIDIMDPELESYFSLFELHMDKLNGSAHYYYTLDSLNFPVEVTVPLTLLSSSNNSYNSIQMTTLEAYVTSGDMHFIANYYALPDSNGNYDTNAICVMEIDDYPFKCTMTNVPSQNRFVYPGTSEFPYLDFPEGDKLVVLTLYSLLLGGDPVEVAKYTAYLTVRKDLQDIMASNLVMNTDGTTMTVYDIPVIKKSYYDNLANPQDFEINCLQKLIADPVLEDYRMLTDFANLKFSNTTGLIVNMLHNKAKYSFIRNGHLITFVINIENDPNIDATAGQIYIVGTNPIGEFRGHENSYAVRAYNGVREYWDYLRPISDDVVYIRDKGTRYIYTGDEWMIPIYTIPLSIELEVFRSNSYFDTDVQLMYDVKAAVISAFQSRFGINAYLYVSELTDVVQSVAGVDHCTVINPRSDIFFNYSVTELTQNELLAYTPEYVYFSESDIKVIVI